jgi:MerR family transcriptional regulator/heat shock protein HspR
MTVSSSESSAQKQRDAEHPGELAGVQVPGATMAATEAPTYDITEAARRAGVHEQTLRHYERLGLITPARKGVSPRSPRRYSADDIERVAHIRSLVDDLGVNLAGVETILHMRDRIEQLRRTMEEELLRLRSQHEAETRRLRDIIARLEQS